MIAEIAQRVIMPTYLWGQTSIKNYTFADVTANVTASVTVQSLGGDGCDGCDGLIELNKKKIEKKSGRRKKQEKFFLETEEKLPVFPSHPSQSQPQTNMNQEVQGIIKPSQLPSQSIKSITDGDDSVLSHSNNESSASELGVRLRKL